MAFGNVPLLFLMNTTTRRGELNSDSKSNKKNIMYNIVSKESPFTTKIRVSKTLV